MRPKNLTVGKAGEFRIASELLLRGYEVFLPITDYGVDLILGDGKRLQIKTAFKGIRGRYSFNFRAWHKEGEPYKNHDLLGVDYIICWAINDNAFFIIPASIVRGKACISLNPNTFNNLNKKESLFTVFKNNWEVLNETVET